MHQYFLYGMNRLLSWIFWGCLLAFAGLGHMSQAFSQVPDAPPETTELEDSSRIDILFIRTLKEHTTPEGVYRELIGDIHLKQQAMHLWCDLGFIYPNKQVEAFGNVQMLQDDSIRIFSDTLYYDGMTRYARLRENVVLTDSSMTMFTNKLNYDLVTRIATFPEESLIESDSSTLISKRGYYNTRTSDAYFHDSVRITNPSYKLVADSLAFNTRTEIASFLGPTMVYNDEKVVYCEDGYYDSKNNYAELYKNAYFINREDGKLEEARGDTIIYNGSLDRYYLIGNAHFQNEDQEVNADTIIMDAKTEEYFFLGSPDFRSRDTTSNQTITATNSNYDALNKTMIFRGDVYVTQESQIIIADSLDYNTETRNSLAWGRVIWVDTTANVKITAGRAIYQDSTQYLRADKDPMLTTLVDNDTLWLKADTLVSLPDTGDARHLYAYHHVRIFKSDMQARCDSLFYDGQDSVFHLFENPILWVDETQFTADTILLQLKSSKLDQVWLYQQSMIVSTQEDTFFNQIKGNNALAQFVDGKVSTMDLYQNGETVYYATDDDGAYMFVNDIDCEDMRLLFGDNQLQRIIYKGAPKAVVHPMRQVDHNSLFLEGFKWLDSLRIPSKYSFLGLPEPEPLPDTMPTEIPIDSLFNDAFFSDSTTILPQDSTTSNKLGSNTIQDPSINTTNSSKPHKKRGRKKGKLRSAPANPQKNKPKARRKLKATSTPPQNGKMNTDTPENATTNGS